jgi:hypothetical protein
MAKVRSFPLPSLRSAGVALALFSFAACYKGKNDVPQLSTSSGSGAGTTTATAAASSGSTSTTGSGGAGTGGAGTGGADPCATALLCDDFESYPTGAPPGGKWTNNQNGGTVAVDGTHVHSGTKAVKMAAGAATGYRSVMINASKNVLPAPGGVVYGRMWFWLDSPPIGTNPATPVNVHWTFIGGYGLVPGQTYHAVVRYGGQVPLTSSSQLMANYDTPDWYQTPPVPPQTDCWQHAKTEVVPLKTWTCAEWMFDTTSNTMRFWQNGMEFTDLAVMTNGQGCVNAMYTQGWLLPTVDTLGVGMESYQADAARNIWIDDVGIGTQQLGCAP